MESGGGLEGRERGVEFDQAGSKRQKKKKKKERKTRNGVLLCPRLPSLGAGRGSILSVKSSKAPLFEREGGGYTEYACSQV